VCLRTCLVARALRPPQRVLHTRQDWSLAAAVPQAESQVYSATGGLTGGSSLGSFGSGRWLHGHALRRGAGGRKIRKTNAARVAGSGCIFFCRWGRRCSFAFPSPILPDNFGRDLERADTGLRAGLSLHATANERPRNFGLRTCFPKARLAFTAAARVVSRTALYDILFRQNHK